MIILGVAGKPDTYRALPSIVDYITLCEGFVKEHPHRSLFTLFLPGVHQVWIAGVHGKLDMECAFTTSEEASSHIGRLLPYYSPRETYMVELSTTVPCAPSAPDPDKDYSNYDASFVDSSGKEFWRQVPFGRTKPYSLGQAIAGPDYRPDFLPSTTFTIAECKIDDANLLLTFTVV